MMGPQMMGPQMMGPMMGPQMMGSMMPYQQPSRSNSEKVFCKIERYGGSGSDSDDYYEGGDGYRRRGRRRSRGKRRRSRRSSYSPTESSVPQNASLYSVPSAPAFLGPMTPMQPQQQQVYQMQPMMGAPQRAAPTAGLVSSPQPPYITDISNDQRDLDAIEKAMKKMYVERYPSENERQSLFPERSLIIILALIFIFVIVVVVIAVMGSSRPGFLHPATQPLPTIKTAGPLTTVAASTTAAANATVKSLLA